MSLWDEIDARIGQKKLLHEALEEPLPGGASWAYVFGSALLILFGVQLVTGFVLAAYYSPSATDAWASIAYLEREITLGAIVRGTHHHAASGVVILLVLHMGQVVLFGAYKAPREANWLVGLLLLGVMLAFALTGYLLPWDQTGYWATKVATSIMGTLPVFGGLVQRVAQGGNDYGNLTLTRFYAIHVIALPITALMLIGAHLALFRKHGITPHPKLDAAQLEAKRDTFWPKQVMLDGLFALAVITLIVALAATEGAPLKAPADPSSNFIARPEWYFLFLFQLLKYTEGPLQIVGTVIIPGLGATFLAALPFLDRSPSRLMRERKPWVGAIAFGFLAIGVLTALAVRADARDPQIAAQKGVAAREAARARELAKEGVPVAGAAEMLLHDPTIRGERVFQRECASCHALEGHAPKERKAPELTGYLSKAWIRQVLRDPDSHRLFGLTKIEGMKPLASLPEEKLQALVEFVYERRKEGAPKTEASAAAAIIEDKECGNCHEIDESAALEGPTLFRYGTEAWVSSVVDDPSADHLYGKSNTMPVFKTKLSEEDRRAVVHFVLTLESRGDERQWPYVDEPAPTPRTKTSSAASHQ